MAPITADKRTTVIGDIVANEVCRGDIPMLSIVLCKVYFLRLTNSHIR